MNPSVPQAVSQSVSEPRVSAGMRDRADPRLVLADRVEQLCSQTPIAIAASFIAGAIATIELGNPWLKWLVLFGWVLLEQMGLPIPAAPLLIATGALARAGKMNLTFAVALAFIAVILADLFWYSLGRYRGGRILKLLCRISLEPDSCVRRTENLVVRRGVHSLLVAKFVPGLNTAAPSLAGVFRMPVRRFIIFDCLGALLWVATVTIRSRICSLQYPKYSQRARERRGCRSM